MATKPTDLPIWATVGADIVEPLTAEKELGWVDADEPPAQWFNWWMNLVYLWAVWLDAYEDEAHTWTDVQTFNSGVDILGQLSAQGDAVFDGTAEFNDVVNFEEEVEIDELARLFSTDELNLQSEGGGAGDLGLINLFSGAGAFNSAGSKAGQIALWAKEVILGGISEEDDAGRITFGDPAGPNRVLGYIINGTVWIAWNALYDDTTETWGRLAAGDSFAIAVGADAGATTGLPENIKLLRRGGDETDDWDSYGVNGWWPMGLGSGAQAGANGSVIARMAPVTPALGNNYIASPLSGVEAPQYWKDALGNVYLQGVARAGVGSSTNPAFTLPGPFCPGFRRYFLYRGSVAAFVQINTNGEVIAGGAAVGEDIHLDGIVFQ